jgi:putative spermidine/putrescine transport system permease protein
VTGLAQDNVVTWVLGLELGFFATVVAHATSCMVTVFNDVRARFSSPADRCRSMRSS